MRIVAMDLGKSKSVICDYDSKSGKHTFRTIRTRPQEVHDLLVETEPDRVVIETGPSSGWVYDLARALGIKVQVANTNHEHEENGSDGCLAVGAVVGMGTVTDGAYAVEGGSGLAFVD